jgi:hypothetical protein
VLIGRLCQPLGQHDRDIEEPQTGRSARHLIANDVLVRGQGCICKLDAQAWPASGDGTATPRGVLASANVGGFAKTDLAGAAIAWATSTTRTETRWPMSWHATGSTG